MANNPYSPPVADVTERAQPEQNAAAPMPRDVKIGLVMLVLLHAYTIYQLDLITRLKNYNEGTIGPLPLLLPLATQVLYITVLILTFRRRNWARITLVVFFGLGLFGSALSEYALHRTTPAGVNVARDALAVSIFLLLITLRAIATVLLFTPTANAWFRRR